MIDELVKRTRTVRRFQEERQVSRECLLDLLDLARLGGSARNGQPLRYVILDKSAHREMIFPLLGWAGYLKNWSGPQEGERPSAYILCLVDQERLKGPVEEAHFDLGIASQNLLLGAANRGIYGCRIGNFSQKKMQEMLQLEKRYIPLLVLALGYAAEQVKLEELEPDGDIRYWRDAEGVHHVPKRPINDIVLSLEL